jgi:hypothetical protein
MFAIVTGSQPYLLASKLQDIDPMVFLLRLGALYRTGGRMRLQFACHGRKELFHQRITAL